MPPPAASPPALKFLVTSFTYSCVPPNIIFTAITDVACHLTAHVAHQRPIIRRIPYEKRGADFVLSSVTCFVPIEDPTQDEAGDTTTHTFTISAPICDKTYYWYLSGTIGGVPCTSISQIFWKSCPCPYTPFPFCSNTPEIPGSKVQHLCCRNDGLIWFAPSVNFTAYRLRFTVYHNFDQSYPCPQSMQLWEMNPNRTQKTMLTPEIPWTIPPPGDNQYREYVVDIPPTLCEAGKSYCFYSYKTHAPWADQNSWYTLGSITFTCPPPNPNPNPYNYQLWIGPAFPCAPLPGTPLSLGQGQTYASVEGLPP